MWRLTSRCQVRYRSEIESGIQVITTHIDKKHQCAMADQQR